MFEISRYIMALLMFVYVGMVSADQQLTPRLIKMGSAVDGVGWNSPRAQLSVHPFDPRYVGNDVIDPFVELSVQGVPCGTGRNFYTLYMHTPSFGRQRILSFNTNCNLRTFHGDAFLPRLIDPTLWFTEALTVEIAREYDDGIDEEYNIVLRGED